MTEIEPLKRMGELVKQMEVEANRISELGHIRITIRAARTNRNLNATKAAEELGIGRVRLSQFENDSTELPESILDKMVEVYGIPKEALILGNEEEITGRKKPGGGAQKEDNEN